MEMITRVVSRELAATAQAFYGIVAMGVTSAASTLASGPLYARFGAASFWLMAVLCALALPVALACVPRRLDLPLRTGGARRPRSRSTQAGAWSLALDLPRTSRSTPASARQAAVGTLRCRP